MHARPAQTPPEARHGRQTRRLPASLLLHPDPAKPQSDPPFFFSTRARARRVRPPVDAVKSRSGSRRRLRAAGARRHEPPHGTERRRATGTTWSLRARLASRRVSGTNVGSWRVFDVVVRTHAVRAPLHRIPHDARRGVEFTCRRAHPAPDRRGGPRAVNSPGSERSAGGGEGWGWVRWIHIHDCLTPCCCWSYFCAVHERKGRRFGADNLAGRAAGT